MSFISFFLDQFQNNLAGNAIAWRDNLYTYGWLRRDIIEKKEYLKSIGIGAGSVVVLQSEYALATTSLLLALIDIKAIIKKCLC